MTGQELIEKQRKEQLNYIENLKQENEILRKALEFACGNIRLINENYSKDYRFYTGNRQYEKELFDKFIEQARRV